MVTPHGRQIRRTVHQILQRDDKQQALDQLAAIPDKQLVGPLFSGFHAREELIRWRSATAMGHLGLRIATRRMEDARVLMRRLMWTLNDESGGIGWGSPEAMGEILSRCPELAMEFDTILFSYLPPGKNQIDHPMLQRGLLWGIGTYAGAACHRIPLDLVNALYPFLASEDPVKRGFALRALAHPGADDRCPLPEHLLAHLLTDTAPLSVYTGWDLTETRISDMARADHSLNRMQDNKGALDA